jgi:hypothetical protein
MRRTLAQIREGIADPRLRLRFDAVFRARNGAWIADLHDAALDRAGRRLRGASWRGAHPGLVAAGWLGPGDTTSATVAQSLYRLAHLQRTDTTRFRLAMERVRLAPEAAPVVEALLTGYDEAARWHAEAVTFLISAPWIAGGPGRPPRALPALLAEFWGRPVVLPEVETAWFGYAQAVPRYAAPPELVQRLLEPDNWTGAEWLRRNGDRRLLTILQRLGADSFPPVTVVTARGPLRLTTVRRLAAERAGGFLAPEDAVVVDPGFPPLLALGSIVHEWQHLEFERARWAAGGTAVPAVEGPGGTVLLRPSEPIVTEGFAEWSTELVLAPLERRYPFLAVAERLKRARFAVTQPDDPHLAGYLLARTLAAALPAADAAARLVAASVDPTAVLDDRRVAEAWQRHRGAADRRTASAGAGLLVPETRFTIEGGWPDVVETRIHP